MRKRSGFFAYWPSQIKVFFMTLILVASGILLAAADFGESSTSLGQITDEFDSLDNVSVRVLIERNATLNAMELNYSTDGLTPTYTFEADALGAVPAGWLDVSSASCSARVSDDVSHGGTKSMKMIDNNGAGWSILHIASQFDETEVTYFVYMAATTRALNFYSFENAVDSDILAIVVFRPDGNIDALDGVGTVELMPYSALQWYKVRIVHDLGNNNYDVYIDDNLEADDFDYFNGAASSFKSCKFQSGAAVAGGTQGYVDDVTLGSTSGYHAEGYFTTEDYLTTINGSVLVQLTNTTIPAGTGITSEFSEDNSTWVNPTTLTAGFMSIDLRDQNWSSAHYVRYNMTGTASETPRLYQSRLITTQGVVGPGAPGQNVSSEWVTHNLTSIDVLIGTHDSGDVNSTLDIDGDTFNCSEVAGAPGYRIGFNWTGVDDAADCLWVVSYVFYDGNQAHDIHIELWNFTSLAWVEIGTINDGVDFSWENVTVYGLRIPNDFVNSTGAVLGRFDHVAAGNINHDVHVEYLKLLMEIPAGPAVGAGAVTVIETNPAPYIAIAIILMCVAYLLTRSR